MKYVVKIGHVNKQGKFSSQEWVGIIFLLQEHFKYFVLYCFNSIETVVGSDIYKMSDIIPIEEIEETCGYKAFKVFPKDKLFWEYLLSLNFDPDEGISHFYAYDHTDHCIVSLEVDDGDNYMIIDNINIPNASNWNIVKHGSVVEDWKPYVVDLVEGDKWSALIKIF